MQKAVSIFADPDGEPAVPCVACREPIKPDATTCIHCNSAQGWTRHIFRWTGLVGALIGIAPAWSIAVSLWAIAFPSDAQIALRSVSCGEAVITVAAENTGGRPGIVGTAELTVFIDGKQHISDMEPVTEPPHVLVDANETVLMTYRPMLGGNAVDYFPRRAGSQCELELSVPILVGGSRTERGGVRCPCT